MSERRISRSGSGSNPALLKETGITITQQTTSVGINYDNANRRTSLTLPNGVTVVYTYDNDSHLRALTYSSRAIQLGTLTYNYDVDGRRAGAGGTLAAVNLPQAVSGNAFNADNAMTGFNGTMLTYDATGNLIGDGTNTYTWDARNHLSAISGGATASFVYDAFGRRMSKLGSGATTQFLYDGSNPVQELDGSSPPNVTANLLTRLGIDEYFTRTDPLNGTQSFLGDMLGSTLALTNSSGAITTSYSYEPFGATTVGGSANGNSYEFTGRENDGTGLYYYRARYYSPKLQRFVSQDPIGFAGGDANFYAYVRNNPLDFVDPVGLTAIPIEVKRTTVTDTSTTGDLSVAGQPVGKTLELPPGDNDPFTSSIPQGNYFAQLYNSPSKGETILLSDVPGRTGIEIHKGNYPEDTQGCILPGTSAGADYVNGSGAALQQVLGPIHVTQALDRALGEATDITVDVK